ncbi:MAG: UDP-N-acetylmuramate dehydrogenase [Ignavibacteriales bacterium]|nr:MAG: UDP-N-acetylmuramate dehydrogenase [Ignavibacteriales bacterium]
MQSLKDYSLKHLNTFGIDVKAKYFTSISSAEELIQALASEETKNEKKFILGGGSNVLFTENYDGLIIHNQIPGINTEEISDSEIIVTAGAGVIWQDLVSFCIEKNYGGIENLSLIPGTVGAAPIQNIGAYGQELKEVFFSLKAVMMDTYNEVVFLNDDCKFGYRNSVFKNELKNKLVITSVSLKLKKDPMLSLDYGNVRSEVEKLNLRKITIKDVGNVISQIRRNKLPDPQQLGNAGSFFKNPEITLHQFELLRSTFPEMPAYQSGTKIKIPAGWLIEKAGLKGFRVGDAGTHSSQALVIVNYGNASGKELVSFADRIRTEVYNKFDIWLEAEVNII